MRELLSIQAIVAAVHFNSNSGASRTAMPLQKQTLTILCYLALATCFSSFFWALMIASGHVGAGKGLYVAGLMWCPAAAALATCYVRRVDFSALGLRWGGARYALLSYFTPLAYATIGYALIWIFGFGFFPDPSALAAIAQKLGWTGTSPIAF